MGTSARVKADVLRPVFEWGTTCFNGVLDASDDPVSLAVLEQAFSAAFEGAHRRRTRELFPLVLADQELWAVFLRAVHHGEVTLAPVLARHHGVPADDMTARMQAATIATAFRVAIERSAISAGEPLPQFLDAVHASGLVDPGAPQIVRPAPIPETGRRTP